MKITISKDRGNEFRFLILAGNGEPIARSSEGYKTLQGCLNGLRSTIENIKDSAMIKRKVDVAGKPFFTIDAPNGNILTIGESYSSKQMMEKGIISLINALSGELNIVNETDEPIDVEVLLKAGLPIPSGNKYLIKIDGKKVIIKQFGPTGKEILAAVNKDASKFELIQKLTLGRTEKVEIDERVDLRVCGVEKFVTIPLDQTNGKGTQSLANCQRDFSLLAPDQIFLEESKFTYDLIKKGNQQWLIIKDYPIPTGYQVQAASLALLMPSNYPDTQIDMAYFSPSLALSSRKAIPQTQCNANINGKQYQRWSRHRTSANPWRPGVDDLSTHLRCIKNWLLREIN